MSFRGSLMMRKFQNNDDETKCYLFCTFFYHMYNCSFLSRYKKSTLSRLRVCYNSIMRKFLGLPLWVSTSHMFVTLVVQCFQETYLVLIYSILIRIGGSLNSVISSLSCSDAFFMSTIRKFWREDLYVCMWVMSLLLAVPYDRVLKWRLFIYIFNVSIQPKL